MHAPKVAFVVANEMFRDEELFEPKAILDQNGVSTTVVALEPGFAVGKLGGKTDVEMTLNELSHHLNEFDAVAFVGGGGASVYFESALAHTVAQKVYQDGKIIAAICIAPVILMKAGILHGKRVTSYPDEKAQFTDCTYTGSHVEVDGSIITADGPKSATAFGQALLEKLRPVHR